MNPLSSSASMTTTGEEPGTAIGLEEFPKKIKEKSIIYCTWACKSRDTYWLSSVKSQASEMNVNSCHTFPLHPFPLQYNFHCLISHQILITKILRNVWQTIQRSNKCKENKYSKKGDIFSSIWFPIIFHIHLVTLSAFTLIWVIPCPTCNVFLSFKQCIILQFDMKWLNAPGHKNTYQEQNLQV